MLICKAIKMSRLFRSGLCMNYMSAAFNTHLSVNISLVTKYIYWLYAPFLCPSFIIYSAFSDIFILLIFPDFRKPEETA